MTTTAQALPVAIIGAGLAGLSCAQALVQAGHQVHVFDKSRGPSGRMSTRRTEDPAGPWQCDHGAQYFTARDATFRAEVARWQQAGVAALWDARLASFDGSTWSTPETPLERFVGAPRMTSPAGWLVQGLQQADEFFRSRTSSDPETHAIFDMLQCRGCGLDLHFAGVHAPIAPVRFVACCLHASKAE